MMAEIINLEDDIEAVGDLVDNGDFTVVVFTAPEWCSPCRRYAPHVAKAAEILGDDVTIVKYDMHWDTDANDLYFFQAVPTTIIFNEGSEIARFSGAKGAIPLLAEINAAKG